MFEIGQRVIATKMPQSSFYRQVEGTVVSVKNDWVDIRADKVMDQWSEVFEDHPTSCMTSAKIENVVLKG